MNYRPDGRDIKIGLATVFYQERKNLQRLVESARLEDPLSPDVWFMVDGPYIGFMFAEQSTPQKSTDGSREYLSEVGKVILDDYVGLQPEKRNRYVELGVFHKCDVLLIVDADEYFLSNLNWDLFRKALANIIFKYDPDGEGNIFSLELWPEKDYVKAGNRFPRETWINLPRVWHRPEYFEYYAVHYWVRHKNRKERVYITKATIYEGLRLGTDSNLRDRSHTEAKDRWAEWQLKRETRLEDRGLDDSNILDPRVGDSADWRSIVNPLMVITQARDISQFLNNIQANFQDIDKLWLKYYTQEEAYNKARDIFLEKKQYTHLILMSDDLIAPREGLQILIKDIMQCKYQVISGWCNFDITPERKDWTCTMKDKLPPEIPHRGTLADYDFIKISEIDELRKEGWTVIDVSFSGFPLQVIGRNTVENIPFRGSAGCCHDACFALDLHKAGIIQYCDLRVYGNHLKLNEHDVENFQVGKKEPDTVWELRKLL